MSKELEPFDDWFKSNRSYFEVSHETKDESALKQEALKAYRIVEEVCRNPNAYARKSTAKKKRKKR